MDIQEKISLLTKYLTSERKERIQRVLDFRTRYLNVVLEDIFQPHNASATLRSCEAFGVQDVHVLEQGKKFSPVKTTSAGSSKWLSLHYYNTDIKEVYAKLRKENYTIFATCPHEEALRIDSLELERSKKISIVFGNETKGLSEDAIKFADKTLYLPMYGFVESFNISVSVAIALAYLVPKVRTNKIDWKLKKEEREEILLDWLMKDVHKSEDIIERCLQSKQNA